MEKNALGSSKRILKFGPTVDGGNPAPVDK